MTRRYWSEELIHEALFRFARKYGLPLTLHRYRRVRRGASDKFDYPSHEVVYQRCGDWRSAREIAEKRAQLDQVGTT